MYDVLHQLIDRVRWSVEEEQKLAHEAVEDWRAQFDPQPAPPSTEDTKAPALSAVDSPDTKAGNGK